MNTLSTTVTPTPEPHGPFAALRRVFPTGQVIRFLLVGASNTFISLVIYGACVWMYGHLLPAKPKPLIADFASITSKPVCITIAFLCFKHFVFKTKGNYLKEWVRCLAVYSISTPAELVILPVATHLFQKGSLTHPYAPYLAGLVNALIIATYSYFGHKKFSFKR